MRRTPVSEKRSQPSIFAPSRSPSASSTTTDLPGRTASVDPALVITWALVSTVPSESTTKPEPCDRPLPGISA
jgi:hypothetical protein